MSTLNLTREDQVQNLKFFCGVLHSLEERLYSFKYPENSEYLDYMQRFIKYTWCLLFSPTSKDRKRELNRLRHYLWSRGGIHPRDTMYSKLDYDLQARGLDSSASRLKQRYGRLWEDMWRFSLNVADFTYFDSSQLCHLSKYFCFRQARSGDRTDRLWGSICKASNKDSFFVGLRILEGTVRQRITGINKHSDTILVASDALAHDDKAMASELLKSVGLELGKLTR